MNSNLLSLIKKEGLKQQADGIYLTHNLVKNQVQEDERKLREQVSSVKYDNYLDAISNNHSIPVMDFEIDLFLNICKDFYNLILELVCLIILNS